MDPSQTATLWRPRWRAAGAHFVVNIAVAGVVASLVFLVWYPETYRAMSGGTELFQLVVGVDVILGPVITFVIFDRRKPVRELVRDLGIVVALQLAALTYGLHMVYVARPVVAALEEDRFRIVAHMNVLHTELQQAGESFRSLSLTGPQLVYTALPTEPEQRNKTLGLGLRGWDIGTRPSLWRPWDADSRAKAVKASKPMELLLTRYPKRSDELLRPVVAKGKVSSRVGTFPVIAFRGDWTALIDLDSGDLLGFVPVDSF
jgi:hypothetical protein